MTDRPSKPPKTVSIPVTLAITLAGMLVSAVVAAQVVRSDVGFLVRRMDAVEGKVETVGDEVRDLDVSRAARIEWQAAMERRLTDLEMSLDKNTDALNALRDALARRR